MATLPRPLSAMRDFLRRESAGGIVLMAASALAILVANSALAARYSAARASQLGPLTALHWVNDGAMAVFFLLVGLEIKRELLDGELDSWRRRRLPGVAALAGMALPALIFAITNHAHPTALRGWGIPSATDIAFALGVLALLGPRVPASLKVFLTAVAILDDMGAVGIIAVFYTERLNWAALGVVGAGLAALVAMNRLGVMRLWPYLLPAPAIWWAMHLSGVHATIAGVAIAACVPLSRSPGHPDSATSPLHILEHALQPWVAFVIVPVFGFMNAGLAFGGITAAMLVSGVTLGIAGGLFAGKQIGIAGTIFAAGRLRFAPPPERASWRQIYGVALLCGIGFTMSLFIGDLAFRGDTTLDNEVKLGVLIGSGLSAAVGTLVLLSGGNKTPSIR